MPILNMIAQWSWGGGGGNVGEPTNFQVTTSWLDATIKWTDNNLNSIPPTTFSKSELVRKVGSAPATPSDWTVVVTETVMNTYQSVGYVDAWLTDWTTYYYRVFSYSTDWAISYCNAVSVTPTSWGRQPWVNTLGYYTMNNDITNQSSGAFPDWVLNTASFSTTKAHGYNTYSLYCNGSTYAYLPWSSVFEFGTSDFTISCWVYSLTNSWQYPWFIGNWLAAYPNMWDAYRISDRFDGSNEFNFCWHGTDWNNYETHTSIYNDGWHNCVITRSSGVVYIYLDWVLKGSLANDTSANLWTQWNMFFGYNIIDSLYSTCYLNDVIFEDVARSSQDVADYYTLTS